MLINYFKQMLNRDMQLMVKHLIPKAVLGTIICFGGVANADQSLTMMLDAYKVANENGKLVYIPVKTAPSGSVIHYKATYKNNIDRALKDVIVVLPIPTDMTFTGKAFPASAQASVDGKNFADIPLMKRTSGKLVKVPLNEYTSLRWNIKHLPAHKSAEVAFNAQVN